MTRPRNCSGFAGVQPGGCITAAQALTTSFDVAVPVAVWNVDRHRHIRGNL